MLIIQNMFCEFKTVCFYLKVISCLLLVRKFWTKVYNHNCTLHSGESLTRKTANHQERNADCVTYHGKVYYVVFLMFCLFVLLVSMVTFYLTFLVQITNPHSVHTGPQKGTKNVESNTLENIKNWYHLIAGKYYFAV